MKPFTTFPTLAAAALMALLVAMEPARAQEASPVLESYAPAGYDLTVRLNVRKALDAPELEPIRQFLMLRGAQDFVDDFFQITGIDLQADLDQVVLAGYFDKARKKEQLFFIRGKFDEAALVNLIGPAPQYRLIQKGDYRIHGFWAKKEREMRYFCFLAKDSVVFGPQAGVEECVGNLVDKGRRMVDDAWYSDRLKAFNRDTFVGLAALAPKQLPKDEVGQALLGSVRGLGACLEVDKGFTGLAEILLADGEKAALGLDMIKGILALGQLQDKQPVLAKAAAKVLIESRGSLVKASISMSEDELRELLALHPKLAPVVAGENK